MEPEAVEEILTQAGKAVAGLPEHLQGEAFKLAVTLLSGQSAPSGPSPSPQPERLRSPGLIEDGALADVSDLLRVSKRNPDRYLVFMQHLEAKGEDATSVALAEQFRVYRQDMPKLPARDLGDMVAKGLIEQVGKGRGAPFLLKRKGRERLAQLAATISAD